MKKICLILCVCLLLCLFAGCGASGSAGAPEETWWRCSLWREKS